MRTFGRDMESQRKKPIIVVLLLLCASLASADEPDAAAKDEIAHLFSSLAASGCQFYRNGSWYSPSRAVGHLQQKYEYFLKRKLVSTAESFIKQAATASSTSGDPYLVKCGEAPAIESATWFIQQLTRYRATPK